MIKYFCLILVLLFSSAVSAEEPAADSTGVTEEEFSLDDLDEEEEKLTTAFQLAA